MRLKIKRIAYVMLSIVYALMLVACSSKGVNEPKALSDNFYNKISVNPSWRTRVGDGDEGLKLNLTPVLRDSLIYSVDVEGVISIVDAKDGREKKVYELDERISSGIALDRIHMYVTSFQGELICLSREDGKEVWRAPLTSESVAPPAVNGKQVIVQTIDGKISAFDALTGNKLWRYDSAPTVLSLRGTAKPLVSRKYTVASFANGEVYTFDNATGRPMWKAVIGVPKGRTELERLVDVDGQVILEGDRLYAVGYQGKLMALSAIDGDEIWSKELSSFNRVALGFGNLYITSSDGVVVAVNKNNGNVVWRNEDFMYRRLQSPQVFDRFVMTSDFEGYLHFLTVDEGETVARKRIDNEGLMGDILVEGSQLYSLTRSGYLVSYKLGSGDIQQHTKHWSSRENVAQDRALGSTEFHHRD